MPSVVLNDAQPVGIPVQPSEYPRFWASADYLLFFLKGNNINAPLVTLKFALKD